MNKVMHITDSKVLKHLETLASEDCKVIKVTASKFEGMQEITYLDEKFRGRTFVSSSDFENMIGKYSI